jgi:DNA replication protein DnaC
VADARYGDPNFGRLVRCGCLEATLVAARQAATAARSAALTAQLAAELGKLGRCTLDSIDRQRPLSDIIWRDTLYPVAHQRQMLTRACGLARQYDPCESLYLYGPPGGCKSHLAAAILNSQAQAGVAGRYGSMPAILRLLRGGFRDGSTDDRLEALMDAELLVLDDLGTEQGGGWADAQLFDLLSVRIAAGRATIITSNLLATEHADSRIASRLAGDFTGIPLILSDYRLVQAERRSA